MSDKPQPSREDIQQRMAAMQHGTFARSWQEQRNSNGSELLQGGHIIDRGDSISSAHSRSATDIARQIGLATIDTSPQAPLSGPLSTRSSHSSLSLPQAPLSAPHTLSPPSNAPRSPGADWRSLVEGPDSGLRGMRSSVSSLGSQHSVASFDPSTVSGERSTDSLGSFTRASRKDSQGSSTFLSHEPSGDSLRASTGGDASGRRWALGRAGGGGEDRDRLREQLPMELRTYGAPPEYIEVSRSTERGVSSVQAGGGSGARVVDHLRRSEVGQATTVYELSSAAKMERGGGGSSLRESGSGQSLRDTIEDPPLPEFWNTGKAAGGGPGSGPGLRESGRESPAHSSSRGSVLSVSADPSQEAPSGDDNDSQRRSVLSDAVIRKLKLKNAQLEKDLRDKKKQVEEMTKSVVSWKKAVKEKHVAKVEQVEGLLNQRLHRSHNLTRKLRVKLVGGVVKRHVNLSAMAAFSHWHEQVETAKVMSKLSEAKGRGEASERMVVFLKEQLNSAGLVVPRGGPDEGGGSELKTVNAVLESMLSQIPSGSIGAYDAEGAVRKATSSEASVLSKLQMLWAELRELVGSSTKDSQRQEGGISNELAIARLRGKVDHMQQMLKAREEESTQLRSQLENQAKRELSAERVDELNKEVARANVRVKELERTIAEAQEARTELMGQLKQQSARVNSLSAQLQSKEAEGATLSALQQQIAELHATARELDAQDVPSIKSGGDAYSTLKALGQGLEQLSNSKAQLTAQKQDAGKRLAVTQKELAEALEREAQLSIAEGRIKELQGEVEQLKERDREVTGLLDKVAGELEAVREEKATLQAQASQMLRDAERVSNLARERAAAVSDKTREVETLQRELAELAAKQEERKKASAKAAEEVAQLTRDMQALREEKEEAQRRAEAAEVELAEAVGAGKAAERAAAGQGPGFCSPSAGADMCIQKNARDAETSREFYGSLWRKGQRVGRAKEGSGCVRRVVTVESCVREEGGDGWDGRGAEEEKQMASMEAKMKELQEDNARMAAQVRANSMALRERDAAEVRAQIEQQSMQQIQAEMGKTAAALAKAKEDGEEKAKRLAVLEQQAQGRDVELKRKELELERLREELAGSRSMSKASTEGESSGERGRREEWKTKTGGETPDQGSNALPAEAALSLELVEMLRDMLACKGLEVELLHERLRAKPAAPDSTRKSPADAARAREEVGGMEGAREEGSFGPGGSGQPLSVDEWRHILASGNLSTSFGAFGTKRPVFTSVRKTYFAPRS